MATRRFRPLRHGRWLHNDVARRTFSALFLLSLVVLACMTAGNMFAGDATTVATSSTAVHSFTGRALLDGHGHDHDANSTSNVEIIPGLSGHECDTEWEQTAWGTIVYMCLAFYIFVGVAIICDGRFTDALEAICSPRGLDLSENVAGATFMAAGSSAPELASSFLGVFVSKTDVGLGTILGSAVFNILIIIGLTAILAGKALQLDHKPLIRDNLFYLMSVAILLIVVGNEDVSWTEALVLLVFYCCYIVFLARDDYFMNHIGTGVDKVRKSIYRTPSQAAAARRGSVDGGTQTSGGEITDLEHEAAAEAITLEHIRVVDDTGNNDVDDDATIDIDAEVKSLEAPTTATGAVEEEQEEPAVEVKQTLATEPEEPRTLGQSVLAGLDTFFDVIGKPYEVLFEFTIPACAIEEPEPGDGKQGVVLALTDDQLSFGQKHYLVSFGLSIFWVTILSYFMVLFMEKLGCLWGISPAVMGMTFLAAGTSVPDALGSISVAKEGKGDMAVSNAIGSNVFDICIGLGLPWLISTLAGNDVTIAEAGNVLPSIITLLSIVFVLFGMMVYSKFTLLPVIGWTLLLVYAGFVVFSLTYSA